MRRFRAQAIPGPFLVFLIGTMAMMAGEWPPSANARHAIPVATPASTVCSVAPRSVDEIIALAESLPADDDVWTPFPPGEPADPATTAAITAVVRELEACINTGDFLRVLGLFSDDGAMFRGLPITEEVETELRSLANMTPTPAPEGEGQVLIGPWAARVLDDDRVAAAVLFTYENETPFAEATKALFFVQRDGRWMIDTWTESVVMPGCELPVSPEQAVDPPPGVTVEPWPTGCDDVDRPDKKRNTRRGASTEVSGETGEIALLERFLSEDCFDAGLERGKRLLRHAPDDAEVNPHVVMHKPIP